MSQDQQPPPVHRRAPSIEGVRPYLKWAAFAGAALLTLAWLASLPLAPPATVRDGQQVLLDHVDAPPDWRDTLILQLTVSDAAIQEVRGAITWQTGSRLGQLPISTLSDGLAHDIVVPIGISPDWSGDAHNVTLQLPNPRELNARVTGSTWMRRSPFAFDALLGRLSSVWLPAPPPWSSLALLTGLCLACLVALCLPLSAWRRRLGFAAAAIGGLAGLATAVRLAGLIVVLWPAYSGLDEAAAMARLPHYDASSALNPFLLAASAQLPAGPVLLATQGAPGVGATYAAYRAPYLFYPRIVRSDAMQQLAEPGAFNSVIEPARGTAPLPGWQRLAGPVAGLEIWHEPGGPPPTQPAAGFSGLPLLLGFAGVAILGWAVWGALGWRGMAQIAAALPLGIGILAWWMTVLSLTGVAWTPASIGLPLAAAGLVAIAYGRTRPRPAEPPPWPPADRVVAAVLAAAIGAVALCLVVQATVLPFTDQDSWTTWAFKSRAFFIDGAIQPSLAAYHAEPLSHPSYPPALPLAETWGYVVMGGISERLVKLIFPAFYLSLIAVVWAACRRWAAPRPAGAWVLLLALTPLLLDHAALGNADLAFTLAVAVAVVGLCRWIEEGSPAWIASAALACCVAAWIKLDGMYLGAGILGLAGIVRAQRTARAQTLLIAAIAIAALLIACLPWQSLTHSLGIASETPSTSGLLVTGGDNLLRGLSVIGEEMLLSHNNSAWGLLGGGFLMLWPLCIGAVVLRAGRLRGDPVLAFLVLCVIAIVAFYAGIYVLRPFFSVERYLLHAAPMAIMAASRATGGSGQCIYARPDPVPSEGQQRLSDQRHGSVAVKQGAQVAEVPIRTNHLPDRPRVQLVVRNEPPDARTHDRSIDCGE